MICVEEVLGGDMVYWVLETFEDCFEASTRAVSCPRGLSGLKTGVEVAHHDVGILDVFFVFLGEGASVSITSSWPITKKNAEGTKGAFYAE